MTRQLAGFPYWPIHFDEKGKPDGDESAAILAELPARRSRHVMVFSHGWNNDERAAEDLCARFFEQISAVMSSRRLSPPDIGIIGVLWPSMRWPDETVTVTGRRMAAAARTRGTSRGATHLGQLDGDVLKSLSVVFTKNAQRSALAEMAQLLDSRPRDRAAYARFHSLLRRLAPKSVADEDDGERELLTRTAEAAFGQMSFRTARPRRATAGLGLSDHLWDGAKEAARAVTYWTMKARAGVVGQRGLGPLVTRLHARNPVVNVHLLGHSFGGRLVSFALAGLPASATGKASPVKSLVLLQAAFSHYAFADALPHNRHRGGALKGMAARVNGPIVVTHSRKDTAVSEWYPRASFVKRQDAADVRHVSRWGAMGGSGAQAVGATDLALQAPGSRYAFQAGRFFNLDGNRVIVSGGPPSGAHSDIIHKEIAWAVLAAAGLA